MRTSSKGTSGRPNSESELHASRSTVNAATWCGELHINSWYTSWAIDPLPNTITCFTVSSSSQRIPSVYLRRQLQLLRQALYAAAGLRLVHGVERSLIRVEAGASEPAEGGQHSGGIRRAGRRSETRTQHYRHRTPGAMLAYKRGQRLTRVDFKHNAIRLCEQLGQPV